MDAMTAYCGLACGTCPIHRATVEPDPDVREGRRAALARLLEDEYGMAPPVRVDDCDGCRAGGRLFFGCRECRIRSCAASRGVETCADCPDFGCEPLLQEVFGRGASTHFAHDPAARARLEQVWSDRGGTVGAMP